MDFGIMIIETVELRKMVAADGFVLTNSETYGKEIYLGKNDKPENWHEITVEEYQTILAEQDRIAQEGGV